MKIKFDVITNDTHRKMVVFYWMRKNACSRQSLTNPLQSNSSESQHSDSEKLANNGKNRREHDE